MVRNIVKQKMYCIDRRLKKCIIRLYHDFCCRFVAGVYLRCDLCTTGAGYLFSVPELHFSHPNQPCLVVLCVKSNSLMVMSFIRC